MTNPGRILLALTSQNDLAGIRHTGFHLTEAAHPWQVFREAGYTVDLASVQGGPPPEDGRDETDPAQQDFLRDPGVARQLANTPAIAKLDGADYDAVLFVGGHGTMWDFPNSAEVATLGRAVIEHGGVVAAVCHGPAALINITLSDGRPLLKGARVASFTNAEEVAVGLSEAVPFLLADELERRGATHVPAANFTEQVIVDGRLITGQNPQSARALARAVVATLAAP
ncbi:type 1 glutamine amidotransferase domain-containing protein [Leucobacter sp. 7(1)]|uniref:type 1 glutamine amidotransferase domain-containing protein n=1 Tax=Leucobacter sp. 7(1) TaxID=1255613 RepID=UPI000B35DFE3|nr:type 1 glutamine amidotransferase domain-containing protein [Leucobacter sp. 7(1)]